MTKKTKQDYQQKREKIRYIVFFSNAIVCAALCAYVLYLPSELVSLVLMLYSQ